MHFLPPKWEKIKERLRQAVGGGAHPRRILFFESLGVVNIKASTHGCLLLYLAPPARLELTTLRLGGVRSIQVSYGGVYLGILPQKSRCVNCVC